MRGYADFVFVLFAEIGNAKAQSGHPYKLNWDVPSEELIYRSCGCADACWVAEVRSVRKMTVKATLRCDCEKLYFSEGKSLERIGLDLKANQKVEVVSEPNKVRVDATIGDSAAFL